MNDELTLENYNDRMEELREQWIREGESRAQAESVRLRAVLKAAGITGWTTNPDGSIDEPQYDTDEEEDVRDGAQTNNEQLRAFAQRVIDCEEMVVGDYVIKYGQGTAGEDLAPHAVTLLDGKK